ncbi:MAG: hypothetical protein CMO43_06630 [Verrucomicrobiales bacterium]|nr:hypothetical protein [Verrucomicrobiales bacterium]
MVDKAYVVDVKFWDVPIRPVCIMNKTKCGSSIIVDNKISLNQIKRDFSYHRSIIVMRCVQFSRSFPVIVNCLIHPMHYSGFWKRDVIFKNITSFRFKS